MSARLRHWFYGVAAALVVASGLCWWLVHGVVGQAIGIALITAGLFGAFTFWFVELGWDEERERVSEQERREEVAHAREARQKHEKPARRPPRFRRRPS